MKKLLIYVGENQKFDFDSTVSAISSVDGVRNPKTGKFIGAVFECEYENNGERTIVRISPELETITVEGLNDVALEFSIKLQGRIPIPLHAIDTDYSFRVALQNLASVSDFRRAISA